MKSISSHSWAATACFAVAATLARTPAFADEASNSPRCTPKTGSYFNESAMRKGQSGAVLVEYSISPSGIPERIVVLESTAPESLEKAAMRLVGDIRCDPGREWVANGGYEKRLKMNVIFQYRGWELVKPLDSNPDTDVIKIEAAPLPGIRKRSAAARLSD